MTGPALHGVNIALITGVAKANGEAFGHLYERASPSRRHQ
jgi:hypothetical protein